MSKLPPYFLVSESVRQSAIRLLLSLPIDADKPFVMQIKAKTRSLDQSAKLHAENEELKSSSAIPEDMTLVPKAEFAALETELRRASRKGNLNCDIDPMWDALSEAMIATADKCHD